ncbi:ribonuclease H-like domain-containing protein [Candidatus Acetothermia bacterium]|nr:ribonuclease H-like domain-containing protein [Candidatus Acetothermia bacterium]MBI3643497.1 ribonuclease H-like domain-containing protein [Candidatus Acetothermia bacterium]
MAELVFDIESVAIPLEDFGEQQQQYLLRSVERQETPEAKELRRERILRSLAFNGMTAQVIAIGMTNVESGRGRVYYQGLEEEPWQSDDGNFHFETGSEAEILGKFWKDIAVYDRVVTFNGRRFDCPFLMMRSALHGIRPSRNLMTNRYDARSHCDLLDQLTFYGATRRFNLDFFCHIFGIESPKSHGITGFEIKNMYEQGLHREIALYCLEDVKATAELYRRWKSTLEFSSRG